MRRFRVSTVLFLSFIGGFFGFAESVFAQDELIPLSEDTLLSTRTVQLIALITILSIAPGIVIMVTCFPFLITVLSILRQAIGLQQSPPNMLIVSLSLFLTYFIMDRVFWEAWTSGVLPLINEKLNFEEAFERTVKPFHEFMIARTDRDTFLTLADLRPDSRFTHLDEKIPLSILIPSFLLSEISLAFKIGFLIYLPFLIIDLVVAAILMSMGMMMVPPAIVSLPFKLAFFAIADGWSLIASALIRGYS
jgi:flagellar biosynthesis protein FliP